MTHAQRVCVMRRLEAVSRSLTLAQVLNEWQAAAR